MTKAFVDRTFQVDNEGRRANVPSGNLLTPPMLSEPSTNHLESALYKAVQAYVEIRHGLVGMPELYDVFRGWHPAVTPHLLFRIVGQAKVAVPEGGASERPEWKVDPGRLLFGGQLIKEFRRPAPNQRRLLDEFQRRLWPAQIGNPFFGDHINVATAVEVLRNTAEALNDDHLAARRIRFGTRDNCSYIYWKPVREVR